jgi:hypothetical protein
MRKLRFFHYHFPEFLIFICIAQVFALGIGKTQQQSFSVAKYQKKLLWQFAPVSSRARRLITIADTGVYNVDKSPPQSRPFARMAPLLPAMRQRGTAPQISQGT